MHLESISHSPSSTKKYKAVFRLDSGRTRTIHFGAKGYQDFTMHGDVHRKNFYIKRHTAREDFTNPLTAGALSRWLLWNKPTLEESITDFRHRFHV
jgi:hypothetical protein